MPANWISPPVLSATQNNQTRSHSHACSRTTRTQASKQRAEIIQRVISTTSHTTRHVPLIAPTVAAGGIIAPVRHPRTKPLISRQLPVESSGSSNRALPFAALGPSVRSASPRKLIAQAFAVSHIPAQNQSSIAGFSYYHRKTTAVHNLALPSKHRCYPRACAMHPFASLRRSHPCTKRSQRYLRAIR